MKYFNKVGFVGGDQKIVPRWAADDELLARTLLYQNEKMEPEQIFGRFDARMLKDQTILNAAFSNNETGSALATCKIGEERGSSAEWNDDSEFATPNIKRK